MQFRSPQEIEDWLIRSLAEQADIPIADIQPDMSFANLGIDSIESVGLACELDAQFESFTIKPELFWDVDSIRELAAELYSRASAADHAALARAV